MPINVKLSDKAKESLDWLKMNYEFNNFSDCINTIGTFFKLNYVSPRETISNNYSETIFNFKKELLLKLEEIEKKENDNTERVIKINRRIEEDFIKPISKKIIVLHDIAVNKNNLESNQLLVKNIESNNSNNSDLLKIEGLNKNIISQENSIREYKKIIDEQDLKLKEYHRCLKTLNENMVAEKGFNSKLIINLPKEKAEELFYLIP